MSKRGKSRAAARRAAKFVGCVTVMIGGVTLNTVTPGDPAMVTQKLKSQKHVEIAGWDNFQVSKKQACIQWESLRIRCVNACLSLKVGGGYQVLLKVELPGLWLHKDFPERPASLPHPSRLPALPPSHQIWEKGREGNKKSLVLIHRRLSRSV